MLHTSSTSTDEALLAQVVGLRTQNHWLELRVKDLETQLYGRKSEQRRGPAEENNLQWQEILGQVQALAPVPPAESSEPQKRANSKKSTIAKGPKPLDPALPREMIKLPDPALKDLFCPLTKRPMQAGFVETLEVLARRPAVY
jgi:hypothetical protein